MSQPLPKQIADQLKEAEELEKAMGAPQPAVQAATEPQEQEQEAVEPQGESQAAEEPTEAKQEVTEPVKEHADAGHWESKYRTLQAKYDAEVPRLHQQNRELGAQLDGLRQQVESLLVAKQEEAPKPETRRSVSEQDEETFGSDLIDLQRRVTRDETAALFEQVASLKEELTALKTENTSLKQATHQTVASQYMTTLERLVPDWEQVNADPGWLEWLGEVDSLTGATRQQYLDQANNRQDAQRVAAIFNAYKATLKKPAAAGQELQRQVTPKRTASTPQAQPEKKVWTQAEIAASLDPRKLKQMTSQQIEALMSEIDAAQAENRIV